MKNIKIATIFLLLVYFLVIDINKSTLSFDAFLVLIFSLFFVLKTKDSPMMLIISLFILYCNYSIVVAEYFIVGDLSVPYWEVKTEHFYGISIRIVLLFISIVTLFYNKRESLSSTQQINFITPKDNWILFYSLILLLAGIFLFGLDRTPITRYSVRISPLYGYSVVVFLFAFYFKGTSSFKKWILFLGALFFILGDIIFGGRITSLQIILLVLITSFPHFLKPLRMLTGFFAGLIFFGLIGTYRSSFLFSNINIATFLKRLLGDFFVFDTPVGAYYASATHVAAYEAVEWEIRLKSLVSFLKAIFIGTREEIGNVTIYISNNHFANGGGGIIPSHFFFWMGWTGVLVFSISFIMLLNYLNKSNNNLSIIILSLIVIRVPSWFLYSPLNLFRGCIFLPIIMFFVLSFADEIIKGATNKKPFARKGQYFSRQNS